MLSVSDKYDSVNECKLMKLHIQGVWQNAHEFIRQLAQYSALNNKVTYRLVVGRQFGNTLAGVVGHDVE